MSVDSEARETAHKPMPKTWQSKSGFKIELLGGLSGQLGQWLRCPEPFAQEIPMNNGDTYRLARNYPGYKYEWVYVEAQTMERGEHIGKPSRKRRR